MFASRYMPCPDCGASLDQAEREHHVCNRERRLDFQVFGLRGELDAFETEFGSYLASSQGRFDLWYAERRRDSGLAA